MSHDRSHPIRCRCAKVRGELLDVASASRAVCYCKDCRAWASVLGREADMLDGAGGTTILAAQPSNVRFTDGLDRLACSSFSKRGLLRWYANCCRTPMGNTVRNPKQHFVGLARIALDPAPLPGENGPPALRLFTPSATRPVTATPVAMAVSLGGILARAAIAVATGRWRRNPYFADVAQATPLRMPQLIDRSTRLAA
jgi:hypothetical protein